MKVVALAQRPWRDPVSVAAAFADEPYALVLLTGGREGWSYLALRPQAVLTAGGDGPDPFAQLDRLLGPPLPADPDGPPFQGGVAGLAGYDLGARAEGIALPRAEDWPDLACALYGAVLAFDGAGRRVVAVGRGETQAQAEGRCRQAAAWLEAPAPAAFAGPLTEDLRAGSGEAYEAAVADVIGRIVAGEIFQANVARQWRGRLATGARPFDLFARLAASSAAPYAAYLRLPGQALVSNSPERFLAVTPGGADGGARLVRTEPIKGTRPRHANAATDAALAAELLASAKDKAENLMIVDLMRNDLSRISDPGRVRTPELYRLQSFANVHHLVSTVTGRLQAGRGAADLLRATLPPGSITGAPKVQAMKVIAALEPPRGPFFGSLFWAGLDGAMESSVLIRTAAFTQAAGGWDLEARAGAGIVADSQPAEERRETDTKMAALARALTGTA